MAKREVGSRPESFRAMARGASPDMHASGQALRGTGGEAGDVAQVAAADGGAA